MDTRGLRRHGLWTVLALLGFAAMIARLRRFPRPRFEPVQTFAGGALGFGRVMLARRGETGSPLGWAVVCGGREVLSRPGTAPLELLDGTETQVRVRVTHGEGAGRIATVRARDCAVTWGSTAPD